MNTSSHNSVEIVKLLLEYGADANLRNSYNKTTLDVAYQPNLELINLLKKHTFNEEDFNKMLIKKFKQAKEFNKIY